jgi:hypothetical protein
MRSRFLHDGQLTARKFWDTAQVLIGITPVAFFYGGENVREHILSDAN